MCSILLFRLENKYQYELDRLRDENREYEQANQQWSLKFKSLEAKCDDIMMDKKDLEEFNE
jgi:hypothetical protein